MNTTRGRWNPVWLATGAMTAALAQPALAQLTQRVSVATGGTQGNGHSERPATSADGKLVVFHSAATDLVAVDANGTAPDVFVRDRHAATTVLISVSSAGVQGNGASEFPAISPDGRYVAFASTATNLDALDTDSSEDVFVRDLATGTTELVSLSTAGVAGNNQSYSASISDQGRYVAFHSTATNLVAADTNSIFDVYVRDRVAGTTELVSVSTAGVLGNQNSALPAISPDGRYVAYQSVASNLVAGDFNDFVDVFLRDRLLATTQRVSVTTTGGQANDASFRPSISAQGRYVAFQSYATNLVAGDVNFREDIYVRDTQLATTELISVRAAGGYANGGSGPSSSISPDGRWVTFQSFATDMVPGDTNARTDVFLRDRQLGTTEIASVSSAGALGNLDSESPSLSGDGRYVVYSSSASNLVTGDTNAVTDVFLRDRTPAGFTLLCEPGVAGVASCPCSNPPSGPGRGCDNGAGTGGATLAASGISYLSSDSLVFTTSGETPAAVSIVFQGDAFAATGIVFGQGVRCVSGAVKRLYTKTASGGGIVAPDFAANDPTVSMRSAAAGVPILPGQSRWYAVWYRSVVVPGGCPPTSSFNVTPTGRVTWSL